MGLLDSAMQGDAEFLADADAFGEQVTYTRAVGTVRTPTVIVYRDAPGRDPEYSVNTREFMVWIAYDAGNTFGLSTPPATGDRIAVKNDLSDSSTVSKEYAGMVESDASGWLVRFRS